MNLTIDKSNLLSHTIGLAMVLMALSDILHSKYVVLGASVMSVVAFVLHFPMRNIGYFMESMIFIIIILITSLFNLYFVQNNFGGSIAILGSMLLSVLYIQSEPQKLTYWVILVYLITLGFIAYHLFVLQSEANDIYEGSSRNHAGAAVVFYTIFLLFHLKHVYNIYPILIGLIAVVLSFLLFGRTSIAVSVAIFALVFYFKFSQNTFVQLLMVLLFIGACYLLWIKFGVLLSSETNFGEGLDTPRWELWSIYIGHIDFVNFFTGVDVSTLPLYGQFQGNPHNSFIKFHSRVGIGAIIFIALFLVSLFQYLKQRKYYVLILLVLLTVRAFFDSDILIGNFDFIFFIITFYWVKTD